MKEIKDCNAAGSTNDNNLPILCFFHRHCLNLLINLLRIYYILETSSQSGSFLIFCEIHSEVLFKILEDEFGLQCFNLIFAIIVCTN